MATSDLEEENKVLKMKNNDLVQKVQHWKMHSAQLENDKLDLMKENNKLRMKLSHFRTESRSRAHDLDSAIQSASEAAISHLVQASTAVTRTLELAKKYTRDNQDLAAASPRWSSMSVTPVKDRVHKVAPMMMGGRSIQPFVSLNRMPLNDSLGSRGSNQNRNVTDRALPLPMHILQDVYIPLRRIDPSEFNTSSPQEADESEPDETEDARDEDMEPATGEDSLPLSDAQDFENSPGLDIVHEDIEPEPEAVTPVRSVVDNPLEGPSWLLDVPTRKLRDKKSLEPDSTTEEAPPPRAAPPPALRVEDSPSEAKENINPSCLVTRLSFTPTVRRRKRSSSPRQEGGCLADDEQNSVKRRDNGRVLKVLVPKIILSPLEHQLVCTPPAASPPRSAVFDAPSPNGATDDKLIVLEDSPMRESNTYSTISTSARNYSGSGEHSRANSRTNALARRTDSGGDSDGEQTRSRRNRKQVVYKEKPLNRKLRRER